MGPRHSLNYSAGALDAKVASLASFPALGFLAVAGPTHDESRPPFDWDNTNAEPVPKFKPIKKFDFLQIPVEWSKSELAR